MKKNKNKMEKMNLEGFFRGGEENKTKLKRWLWTCFCKRKHGKVENWTDRIKHSMQNLYQRKRKWKFQKKPLMIKWIDLIVILYAMRWFRSFRALMIYFSATRCEYLWYVCYHARSSRLLTAGYCRTNSESCFPLISNSIPPKSTYEWKQNWLQVQCFR